MTTKTKPTDAEAAYARVQAAEQELRAARAALTVARDMPMPDTRDRATPDQVAAFRTRHALVERLYTQRLSFTQAEAIADLMETEGLDEAEAIRRYDAEEEGNADDN